MRFYDADSGHIQVSGHDVMHMTRHSLRKNYGMVLQETWLKKGTIRENICMGKPDATEEEMIAAAKASHAHSFIRRLSKGYDTEITEDGGNLSQGQKQLLCITRVMLCLPPMLILDEATSSIDTRTEIRIQKAFLTMMKGRTSFIVAHRLSTIREADSILGDTLCVESAPVILESMEFPDPVIRVAIEPKTKAGQEKMGIALAKLAEEDPTFKAYKEIYGQNGVVF